MTKRKFTPPEEFPAEYVDGEGNKAVILGRGSNKAFPFIGYGCDGDPYCWTEHGGVYPKHQNRHDLHDIPKRIKTWCNVYTGWLSPIYYTRSGADSQSALSDLMDRHRHCVYRIERDEDGGNPEIFVEKA